MSVIDYFSWFVPLVVVILVAAIFADHVKVAHVIRKVILRQVAILNYISSQ